MWRKYLILSSFVTYLNFIGIDVIVTLVLILFLALNFCLFENTYFVDCCSNTEGHTDCHANYLQLIELDIKHKQIDQKVVENAHVANKTDCGRICFLIWISQEILSDHVQKGTDQDFEINPYWIVVVWHMLFSDAHHDKYNSHDHCSQNSVCKLNDRKMQSLHTSTSHTDNSLCYTRDYC